MADLLTPDQAEGKIKDLYAEIEDAFGMVPNLFQALAAVDADWLETHWRRLQSVMMKDGALDRKTREMLALAVSLVNQCEYCVAAHGTSAKKLGANDKQLAELYQVVELFISFNALADMLQVPVDAAFTSQSDKD